MSGLIGGTFQFADNRHNTERNKSLSTLINGSTKKGNSLPDRLKAGVESLSGLPMDDVRVHYNSDKPAQLNAHAYAQGTEIHLAAGQEKHLAHEAWHVVQQKQGRVKPTLQLKNKISINDSAVLESEADKMGELAMKQTKVDSNFSAKSVFNKLPAWQIVQRAEYSSDAEEEYDSDEEERNIELINFRIERLLSLDESSEAVEESELQNGQIELAEHLADWRVHANLIFEHGTKDHIIRTEILENALRILILRGDPISLNTAAYIMTANNYQNLVLKVRQQNLDEGVNAKAAQEGKGFRIVVRNNLSNPQALATLLVHEVNHIKNEVAEINQFEGHPVEQLLTEFRAYFVAGNWPVNWPETVTNDVVELLHNPVHGILRTEICAWARIRDLTEHSAIHQCQLAFLFVRERVLATNGIGVDDIPGEGVIRKLLGNHLLKHIYADYPKSHTDNQPAEAQAQRSIAEDFAYRGILPGNLKNE